MQKVALLKFCLKTNNNNQLSTSVARSRQSFTDISFTTFHVEWLHIFFCFASMLNNRKTHVFFGSKWIAKRSHFPPFKKWKQIWTEHPIGVPLKVHKREKFFGSDFEFFTILYLIKFKYYGFVKKKLYCAIIKGTMMFRLYWD